ncbi:uncharacterized protein HMPREF1541_10301 [Cyphellophora europaea CBS 101466]|uniref:DUF1264 domain-containing protein n=1 Tax=Cyphellophora europaea (strain CBS 101466) TaxID=1220924 RepID=W2S7E8_CYPE1|nr:uncharacterized protein HMPREF1541_10301 [Cyphellophora europaea CBS 101466]ETN44631.1 hypothetical protein HMPREF1541_10301 [Cyphellophora europaea CBS 101466]
MPHHTTPQPLTNPPSPLPPPQYLGIQTHVRSTADPDLRPLHNVCEYLNALHIYADEARQGVVRSVDSHHFCSHVSKDFRQCLIYDSNTPGARLIGVEYMIPRARYEKLPPEEQKLWHSHVFEVHSGMLILPYPTTHPSTSPHAKRAWDALETEALAEVTDWYGKIYHFWEVDKSEGGDLPYGAPELMGSLTSDKQIDVDAAMAQRDREAGADVKEKRALRKDLPRPQVHPAADSWWREAEEGGRGIYA